MISNKIYNYISRLSGIEVANTNESGSRYFNAPGVKIRVSDHLACKYNPTSTLNIVCDAKTDSFAVFYGCRIIPIQTYEQLKELLRNFVMVCDILAPLADIRNKPKVIKETVVVERPVVTAPTEPSKTSSEWLWMGDLPEKLRVGVRKNYLNVKKMSRIK